MFRKSSGRISQISGVLKHRFVRQLLSWYASHRRDLPWRKTRDPYRIWVSEVMLQQTQVATVIPYYTRFLQSFPALKVLARAPVQSVLKCWEGLGYYSRARNLHRAACLIVNQRSGTIPSNPRRLETLPGIGRSTAGAIASIAFGRRTPILDGNVRRVLCRLLAIEEDPRLPKVQERLWQFSEMLLPFRRTGLFNQALMELGATVCLPGNPLCSICPVRNLCRAYRLSCQKRIPVKGRARSVPHYRVMVGIVSKGESLLMGPRPDRGLLGGLWGFPEVPEGTIPQDSKAICQAFFERTRVALGLVASLQPVMHAYSHQKITYLPFLFQYQRGILRKEDGWRWVSWSGVQAHPVSAVTRRILDQFKTSESIPMVAEGPGSYRPVRL